MPEVYSVLATVRQPRGDDLGQVTIGYYILADGALTMTDSKGVAVRNSSTGEKYSHRIKPGDDARAIANRLTMEIYYMLRGETAQTATGFGRAINYPASGVA